MVIRICTSTGMVYVMQDGYLTREGDSFTAGPHPVTLLSPIVVGQPFEFTLDITTPAYRSGSGDVVVAVEVAPA